MKNTILPILIVSASANMIPAAHVITIHSVVEDIIDPVSGPPLTGFFPGMELAVEFELSPRVEGLVLDLPFARQESFFGDIPLWSRIEITGFDSLFDESVADGLNVWYVSGITLGQIAFDIGSWFEPYSFREGQSIFSNGLEVSDISFDFLEGDFSSLFLDDYFGLNMTLGEALPESGVVAINGIAYDGTIGFLDGSGLVLSVNRVEFSTSPVPEPASAMVFVTGFIGLMAIRRRRS